MTFARFLALASGLAYCVGLTQTIQNKPPHHHHQPHGHHQLNLSSEVAATVNGTNGLEEFLSAIDPRLKGKGDIVTKALGRKTREDALEFLKGCVDRAELSSLERGGVDKALVDRIFTNVTAHMVRDKPEPKGDELPTMRTDSTTSIWCILMGLGQLALLGIFMWWVLYSEEAMKASEDANKVTPPGAKSRNAVLDNAKFMGHVLVSAYHMHCTTGACSYIAFHTRLFCFISGLVSKNPPSLRAYKSLVFGLAAPIFMYCFVLYPLVFPFIRGGFPTPDDYNYKSVFSNLFKADARVIWFLIALLNWRLWGFMLMVLKPAYRLLVAVSIAAISGYIMLGDSDHPQDGAFKLGNAFVFFPIFVTGQLFPLEQVLEKVPYGVTNFCIGAALLSLIFVVETSSSGTAFMDGVQSQGGWAENVYASSSEAGLFWVREVLFYNMLSFTKILLFLILVCPRSSGIMSDLGANSIYPYLLHVQCFDVIDMFTTKFFGEQLYSFDPVTKLVISLVLCTFLATWPVRAVFWVFLQPTYLEKWMKADDLDSKTAQVDKVSAKNALSAGLNGDGV